MPYMPHMPTCPRHPLTSRRTLAGESLPITRQAGTDLGSLMTRLLSPSPVARPSLATACCELERLALAAAAKRSSLRSAATAGLGGDLFGGDALNPFEYHVHRSLGGQVPSSASGAGGGSVGPGGVVYSAFGSPPPVIVLSGDEYAEFA